jgi:hypothetical protein
MRRTQGDRLGPQDRIAAFAEATETYAESLEDPDLANVYWGKSLGLRQALVILSADETAAANRRVPSPTCELRPADRIRPSTPTRPVCPQGAGSSPGW